MQNTTCAFCNDKPMVFNFQQFDKYQYFFLFSLAKPFVNYHVSNINCKYSIILLSN